MTWAEIKAAVEKAGIADDSEITEIRCEPHQGNRTFDVIHLGHTLKLQEAVGEAVALHDCAGCAS